MSSSTTKRLVVYRFDRHPVEGLAHSDSYLLENAVEILSPEGKLQRIELPELKALCFISESGPANLFSEHSVFEHRPKNSGLWVSFRFKDGEQLEGIAPHNLLEWPRQGYLIVPPRAGVNRQRVFIPRQAIAETSLRGVVGGGAVAKSKSSATTTPGEKQLSMFE